MIFQLSCAGLTRVSTSFFAPQGVDGRIKFGRVEDEPSRRDGALHRRALLTLLAGSLASPLAARAQQPGTIKRVGVLMGAAATQPQGQAALAAFVERLRQLGWSEGRNLRLEVRWNAGDAELAKIFAAQLIGLMPDVILAATSTNLTLLRQMTSSVPIVFVTVTDPVEQGFVASLTRPGGNITGFANFESAIGGKWLALLKTFAPSLARVAVMVNPDTSPQFRFYMQAIESAGASLGIKASAMPLRAEAEIEPAIAAFAAEPSGALILPGNSFTNQHMALITSLAARHRLPSIAGDAGFARIGGLISYGVDGIEDFRSAAGYVDRILKGEKPADLPVQFPTKFALAINLKTAKALGLTVPDGLVLAADEVIE
jgi:putative ABC transport system substrate-binding protein